MEVWLDPCNPKPISQMVQKQLLVTMDPYRFYTYMLVIDKYPNIEIIQLCFIEGLAIWHTPSSWIDSNVSMRWEQRKSKELGTLFGLQHFGGRRACWSSRMKLGRMTSNQSLAWMCTNQTTSWLVHNLNTFGARMSHEQTWTHKTHHGPNLGEATTFPLIVYSVPSHRINIQMEFCPKTPKWEFRNSQSWDSHDFGGP